MKIRLKILSGFLLLVGMLIIAGVLGIIEYKKLSKSVESLLSDNYKSIEASMTMLEALEREDSGILLFLMGQKTEGSEIIRSGDSLMKVSFDVARNNLTEQNENIYIDSIEKSYHEYRDLWNKLLVSNEMNDQMNWYFDHSHSKFLETKRQVRNLLVLNQAVMYEESFHLSENARRAVMPGVVAIVAALVFALLFNFFINYYFVSPINRIIKRIQNFSSAESNFDAQIETNDELRKLEDAIRNLIYKLKRH